MAVIRIFFTCLISAIVTVITAKSPLHQVCSGDKDFSLELYGKLAAKEKGNILVSPVSVELALALAYPGVKGKTKTEMKDLFQFPGKLETTLTGFKNLLGLLSGQEVHLVGRVYPSKTLSIKQKYRNEISKYFSSTTKQEDYADHTEEARQDINHWVQQNTGNKIKNLLAPSDIRKDTGVVLVNALYFKADWKNQFSTRNTKEGTFHISKTHSVQALMMESNIEANYIESKELKAKILELVYKNQDYSLVLVLPNAGEEIEAFENQLPALDHDNILKSLQPKLVSVKIPKFHIEKQLNLKPILTEMGLKHLFTDPDFSDMAKGITAAVHVGHKSVFAVNEAGTEAAAATAVVSNSTPTEQFTADRPFFFSLIYRKFHVPLFVGRLINPKVHT